MDASLSISKDTTLNLNGKTLTKPGETDGRVESEFVAINVTAGTLTIKDTQSSGTITSTKAWNNNWTLATGLINVSGTGSLSIEGLSINLNSPLNAIYHSSSGTINISNCNITSAMQGIYNATGATGKVTINNATIESTGDQAIFNLGATDIDISDSTITASGSYRTAILNNSTGTITLSNTAVTGNGYGISNSSGGTVEVTNTSTITGQTQVGINNSGTLTISESTITGGNQGVANFSSATLNVSSGSITGTTNQYGSGILNSGTMSLSGGTVSSTQYMGVWQTGGSTTITGGEYSGNYGHILSQGGTLNISGGKFNGWDYFGYGGTVSVSGGVFGKTLDSKYIADGYKVAEGSGEYYVIPAMAGWQSLESANNYVYYATNNADANYVVSVGSITDSSELKADERYKALAIPDVNFAWGAASVGYHLAKVNRSNSSATITPVTEGVSVVGDSLISGSINKLTTSGDYAIYIDAEGNGLKTITGSTGNDTLKAGSTAVTLNGGEGDDSLIGGTAADTFIYSGGKDVINGYDSSDNVSVARDFSAVTSGESITGTANNFVLNFDETNSLAFVNAASTGVSIAHGRKNYVYTYDSIANEDGVTLTAGYATTEANLSSSEYVTIDGSAVTKALEITGNAQDNYIVGSTNYSNTLTGGDGDDTLVAGEQDSTLNGGAGDDSLVGGKGKDTFIYTAGNDVIRDFGADDKLNIASESITSGKSSNSRLTFTIDKANSVVFRSDDSIPAQISLTSGDAYLTADGVVSLPSEGTKSLNLFSSAKGRIDLTDNSIYSGASISAIDASTVKNQSVTLVGSSLGGSFSFAENNKKRDGFEYNGGNVTISGYEAGKDRINLGDYSISAFTADDTQVAMSLKTASGTEGFISLTGAKGSEVLVHQSTSKGNSYKKMVFAADGVLYDKKKATSATLSTGANHFAVNDKDVKSTLKKITVGENVSAISITAGDKNMVIDASLAGGVSLVSGSKNDKFIGSAANADTFIYTAGKDIIQAFDAANDNISLSGGSNISLESAKITAGKKSIKFKFGNKDVLTIKSDSLTGAEITINGAAQTYTKNAIGNENQVSLTSQFGGTYKLGEGVNYVDGHLVEKKLTFKGTTAAESLIGGSSKTMFKGGGGADSLVGGKGADTFFYAKGDKDTVTIANFDFDNDKLKIAGGTIAKIESLGSNAGVQFAMKKDKGTDAAAVGWFNVASSITSNDYTDAAPLPAGRSFDAKDVVIKANNTYYWFADGGEILASDETSTVEKGALITSISKVSKSQVSGYEVIELNYATNLVKTEVAVQVKDTLKAHS